MADHADFIINKLKCALNIVYLSLSLKKNWFTLSYGDISAGISMPNAFRCSICSSNHSKPFFHADLDDATVQ